MVKEIGRIPAERNTEYKMSERSLIVQMRLKKILIGVTDYSQFGSYVELIKINKFNYKNPRERIIVCLG